VFQFQAVKRFAVILNLIARTQEEKRGQVIRNQQERSLGLQGRDIADKQLQQATITLFLKEAGGGKMGSLKGE